MFGYLTDENYPLMSQREVAFRLKSLLHRNRHPGACEPRVPIAALASVLGVHRDTLYEACKGAMAPTLQRRLDFMLRRFEHGLRFKRVGRKWILDSSEGGNPKEAIRIATRRQNRQRYSGECRSVCAAQRCKYYRNARHQTAYLASAISFNVMNKKLLPSSIVMQVIVLVISLSKQPTSVADIYPKPNRHVLYSKVEYLVKRAQQLDKELIDLMGLFNKSLRKNLKFGVTGIPNNDQKYIECLHDSLQFETARVMDTLFDTLTPIAILEEMKHADDREIAISFVGDAIDRIKSQLDEADKNINDTLGNSSCRDQPVIATKAQRILDFLQVAKEKIQSIERALRTEPSSGSPD